MDEKTERRIRAAIERCPNYPNRRIAKNLNLPSAAVAQVRSAADGSSETEDKSPIYGISLSSKRVLSRRPAESAAKYIKRLQAGKGFLPRDLARQWGMSEETIKRHARDLGCLKFVEITEDEWQSLVMSPETAAKYD
jgi:hypothetical protein